MQTAQHEWELKQAELKRTPAPSAVAVPSVAPAAENRISKNSWYDDSAPTARAKKPMVFREQGFFQDQGDRQRDKLRLENLAAEIDIASKRTGVSAATKLVLAMPKVDGDSETRVPDIEWWDKEVFPDKQLLTSYDDVLVDIGEQAKTFSGITQYVQHPISFEPPIDKERSVIVPIMLTAKERKKLRTQRRKEEEKEKQEKIRLGLMDPPAPKVKIANLMRVLGMEAVQDPTKVCFIWLCCEDLFSFCSCEPALL